MKLLKLPDSAAKRIKTPVGMKNTAIAKKTGIAVHAVRIGCQAGSFCCRSLDAEIEEITIDTTCGLLFGRFLSIFTSSVELD